MPAWCIGAGGGASRTGGVLEKEAMWMTYPCVSLNTQAKQAVRKDALTAHELKKRTAGP